MKISNIEMSLLSKNILTPQQMVDVKGGGSGKSDYDGSCGSTTDDKRKTRPGGGISTL
jgi:hypothetical protein